MSTGYVLFRLAGQTFALDLDEVREIVRLDRLDPLPGMQAPMAGVIVLRGNPLPVYDVRAPDAGGGDVLVTCVAGDPVGVAVDEVRAVVAAAELPAADAPPARGFPGYVTGVRNGTDGPVLVVDLQRLLDSSAAGWSGVQTRFAGTG